MKKFDLRQIIGLTVMALGLILIIFSVHSMHKIEEAKSTVSGVSKYLSEHPIWGLVGGVLQEKVAAYDTLVYLLLVGGIVLAVTGAAVALFSRLKRP